jgi:thiol-disulfide isomerase/thioredoxin
MQSFLFSLALLAGAPAALAQQEALPVFPDLEMAGAEGGSIRLSQLKGNVILLNVWATWCGPCRLELPIVQRMYDKYSDAISSCSPSTSTPTATASSPS